MTGSMRASRRLVVVVATLLLTYFCWPHSSAVQAQSQLRPRQAPAGLRSPCPHASRINTNDRYRQAFHFICLQRPTNSKLRLDVIPYQSDRLGLGLVSREVDELDTNQMLSFVDDLGTLRVLLPDAHQVNGTSVYSFDANGRALNEKHTVNLQLVTTMALWRLELNSQWNLVAANRRHLGENVVGSLQTPTHRRNSVPELRGQILSFHSWRSTYFDRYQYIDLPYGGEVAKLEPMHIYDLEFLVVAMKPLSAEHQADSLIYRLDYSEGPLNWTHYQTVPTQYALDASSFFVTHKTSTQRDFYIALIGKSRQEEQPVRLTDQQVRRQNQTFGGQFASSSNNNCELIILKFFGNRFVQVNSIPVPDVIKLDTISYGSGDSYVVIALLSQWSRQISLFLFDGLNLKPLPGPPAPPVLNSPRPQHLGPLYSKQKRTLDADSLHLFNLPPSLGQANESTSKRTLADDARAAALPALVFSAAPDANLSGFSTTADGNPTETLYEIPVEEHIERGEQTALPPSGGPTSGYTKRNFISAGQDLLGWCRAQFKTILGDNFEATANQFRALPRVDQPRPIEIKGDLEIEGDLHVSNLLFVNRIEDHLEHRVDFVSLPPNTSQTFDELERAHASIDSLKQQVDQILVDDGSIQEVYTPLRFDKIVFECTNSYLPGLGRVPQPPLGTPACPQVGAISTRFLNGRDIGDIQSQALLTGRTMRVAHDVRFEHLILRGQTSIRQTLNGLPIDEIVFGRGPTAIGQITGHKSLRSGLYSTANIVVANWDGQMVNRQNHLTSSGDQRIEANLKFSQLVLDSDPTGQAPINSSVSSRIEVLNRLHLDTHIDQIAQADQVNNFKVPLVVDELIVNGPAHFPPDSLLSSVNVEALWASTMFKHSHQNVTAPVEFSGDVHVSYGGDIVVGGLVNRVRLTPENVMMRNRDYDLPNPFVFEGDLNVRSLQVEVDLNGIQVLESGTGSRRELAILYDGGDQQISGDKILNEIHLGGNSRIVETINGHLNLSQLYSLVKNDGESFRFTKVRLTHQNIRIAENVPIHIESTINGLPVDEICALANSLAGSPTIKYDRLRFDQQPIAFKSLRCASINGFNNLRSAFLMKHGNQRVAGTLKLVNGVVFNSTMQIGSTFNNLNVAPLARAIAQVINESRTGHKDFFGDLSIDDLYSERINDLPLSSVFVAKADYPQVVTAPMTFDHLDIENVLIVGRELVTGSFNNLNVSEMFSNTLQYDAPQVIYNHVELDHLDIVPGANLLTKSLNGHDLARLYSDSVVVDLPQQVLAPKVFRAPVEFADRISLRFGIDGLSEDELKFNLLLQSDELIDDDLEFNNDVTIMKSLEIQTGIINDVDVNSFVSSMLYENRPTGLRLLGNSSLRFKDVKLNNLVVTGTIQGLDLSRDALLRTDQNVNNQSMFSNMAGPFPNENQFALFNRLYNTGRPFAVQTRVRNETFTGDCKIHECLQPTPMIPISGAQIVGQASPVPPLGANYQPVSYQPTVRYQPVKLVSRPPFSPAQWLPVPPQQQQQPPLQFGPTPVAAPPVILPRPLSLINTSLIRPLWRPSQPVQLPPPRPPASYNLITTTTTNTTHEEITTTNQLEQNEFALVDPRYLEYQATLRARAIQDLVLRLNRYLSVSFYYEIAQKHPLLGPVLHAAENPIPDEAGSAWLLLKAVSKPGEPCLARNQKVSVMAQQRHKGSTPLFTVSSTIQDTSNPALVHSLALGKSNYLFVADLGAEQNSETMSHILVYLWDYQSGMYDLRQRIAVDGFPTTLKAFAVAKQQIGCVALANPRVVQSNHSGAPLMFCQHSPQSEFSQRIVLPLHNIFDLDVLSSPSGQILLAALSHYNTEQMGDLVVSKFDLNSRTLQTIAVRRLVRPLKLHFVKQTSPSVQLVVAEGVTSNERAEATTRIFALAGSGNNNNNNIGPTAHRLVESQIIRDNQFTDIQSIVLDGSHAMVFLKSTHSISIYATTCSQFTLVQRLPLRGANRFLVFNSNMRSSPFGHMLVLSRDDCEHQQYSTVILKPVFK